MAKFAATLVRCTSALALLAALGPAWAIDTLSAPSTEARPARVNADGVAATPANTPAVASPGAEPAGDYQPYALALAGALVMAYIGLRRPPE